MQQFLKNKPFIFSIGLNACLFVLFYTVFYTRYGTTDDVEMQMILSGKAVIDQPYGFLRYTHVFIGLVLSYLYENIPWLPWYGSYLCMAHFWGMTVILYSILILRPTLYTVLFYVLAFVIGEALLLQELQFTSASIVLGSAGIILLYTTNTVFSRNNFRYKFGGFILLLFCSMIRWESFQLSLLLGSPLILLGCIESKKWKQSIVFFSLLISCTFVLQQTHYYIENIDPEWKKFNDFKHSLAAHNILDYQQSQYLWNDNNADEYFYNVGWEYEDYQLFKHWFFADSSVYGLQQFRAIQSSFEDCPVPIEDVKERGWNFIIERPLNDSIFYAFIAIAIALLCIGPNKWTYATLLASAAMVYFILFSLFLLKHLPDRVSFPMGFYLIALTMTIIAKNIVIDRRGKFFSLVLLGLLALSSTKKLIKKSSQTAFQKMYWTAALDSLDASKEQLYIGGGDFYMQAILTPFHPSQDSLIDNFKMLDFGHLSNAPVYYKQLEHFNIENIHIQAVRDSSIYLVHRYNAPILKWYANFLHRHYNMHIEYELVRKETEVDIAVYRIREQIRTQKNSQGIHLANMHEYGINSNDDKNKKIPRASFKEQDIFYFID